MGFPAFSLYDEWASREFAREVVIKMYEGTRKNEKKQG